MIVTKWKHAGSVLIGRDHTEQGKACQDNICFSRRGKVQVLALSDGAGSRKLSEIGSKAATACVCELLPGCFEAYYAALSAGNEEKTFAIKEELLQKVVSAIAAAAGGDTAIEETAATLLFVAIKGNRYIMGHIGDGVIGGLFSGNGGAELKVLSQPENGDAPNITFFVTEKNAVNHLRLECGIFKGLKGIILMSDGPEEALYSNGALHANTLKLFENFSGMRETEYGYVLEAFLGQYISKYSDDDLSLNLLWLEETDSKKAGKEYMRYLLSDITSEEQVIKKMPGAVYLDNTFVPEKTTNPNKLRKIVL